MTMELYLRRSPEGFEVGIGEIQIDDTNIAISKTSTVMKGSLLKVKECQVFPDIQCAIHELKRLSREYFGEVIHDGNA